MKSRAVLASVSLVVFACLAAGPGVAQTPAPSPPARLSPAAGPRFTGAPEAIREIEAAFQRLNRLNGYRVRYSERGVEGASVIDVQNPDRRRTLVPQEGATLEVTQVGARTIVRLTRPDMNGQWRCSPILSAAADLPITNPSRLNAEIAVVKLRDEEIALARVAVYEYNIRLPEGEVLRSRVYVNQAGGLPRRWSVLDRDGNALGTVDYYDYNAPITIQLPARE
ncbi:MAG: hypothetical protein FJX78_04605 [Armatimonadetes bacterium]|nr:hypothetical protein [Armatimonadota bacterium]